MCEKILPIWQNSYVSRKDQQNFLPPILNLVGIPTAIAHIKSRTHIIIWISYDQFKYLAPPSLYSFQIKFLPSPFIHSSWCSTIVMSFYRPLPSQSPIISSPSLFSLRRSCLILLLYDHPCQYKAQRLVNVRLTTVLCECFMWLIYCVID